MHITEEELATYFAKFGVIESVSINRDDRTQRGRGFAFVKFFQEVSLEPLVVFSLPLMMKERTRVFVPPALRRTTTRIDFSNTRACRFLSCACAHTRPPAVEGGGVLGPLCACAAVAGKVTEYVGPTFFVRDALT